MYAENVVIGWRNWVRGATIAATSSEVATLPAVNVLSQRRGVKWRSLGAGPVHVVVDLLQPRVVDYVAALGANLTSAGWIRVRGSSTDDRATTGLTIDSGPIGQVDAARGLALAPARGRARWVRVDLHDPTLPYLEVGHLWIGEAWQPARNFEFGWRRGRVDVSSRIVTEGGTVFTDLRPTRKRESIRLPAILAEEVETADALVQEVDAGTDVLLSLRPARPDAAAWCVVGQLDESPALEAVTSATWAMSLTVTERL